MYTTTAKTELKSIIVYEIQHVFGRKIVSSRDCIELSEEIFQKTQSQLNPNTLRRFFNLVKAEYPPSQSTMTILSKYCGFWSTDEIYTIRKAKPVEEASAISPEIVLHYLVSMFRDIQVKDSNDETYLNMAVQTIQFLNSNEFLADKFQSQIAKTTNGNTYYFEQLINIDKLNSYYGNGLRYYLKEKGTVQAEIFTNSLNALKFWLNGDTESLLKCTANFTFPYPLEKNDPYIQARQFAALLFRNTALKADSETARIAMNHIYTDMTTTSAGRKTLSHFTYIISEALLLTGHAEDAHYYLSQTRKIESSYGAIPHPLNYNQNYLLLEAYAMFKTGRCKQAEVKFNEIKSSEFSFLQKKFSIILYLSLQNVLKPGSKSKKYDEQFNAMIDETGFNRMKSAI